MFQVEDPGFSSVMREVPVMPSDRRQGFFTGLFRRVPWPKWRELVREQVAAQQILERLGDLLKELAREKPANLEAVQEWEVRGVALFAAFCQAEDRSAAAVRAIVSWGLAGHTNIINSRGITYPVSFDKVEWLGKEWAVLSSDTLDMYHRLGLLTALAVYVIRYQENKLPETLDGFFPKVEEGKEE